MKLNEITQSGKGTYSAIKFDESTLSKIQKYIKDNDIPNGLKSSKIHTTILYSRKYCPDYVPMGKIDPPWKGIPTKFDVWMTRDEVPKRCLVVEYDCDELHARHKELMAEHKATYDFPQYKSHITLSYDIGDMKIDKLPPFIDSVPELIIVKEYGEDLDLTWHKKTVKKKD